MARFTVNISVNKFFENWTLETLKNFRSLLQPDGIFYVDQTIYANTMLQSSMGVAVTKLQESLKENGGYNYMRMGYNYMYGNGTKKKWKEEIRSD